jgi:hypothetical protein
MPAHHILITHKLTCLMNFLCSQRYGLLLSADELSSFEPLRDNYEVDYYLKQAAAAHQQQQQQQGASTQQQKCQAHRPQQEQQQQAAGVRSQHLTSTVKNRRLAFMRRLEQEGEYFSEHAMREREPLVWQDCIGTPATVWFCSLRPGCEGLPHPPHIITLGADIESDTGLVTTDGMQHVT